MCELARLHPDDHGEQDVNGAEQDDLAQGAGQ
jgi:hypothetical protein